MTLTDDNDDAQQPAQKRKPMTSEASALREALDLPEDAPADPVALSVAPTPDDAFYGSLLAEVQCNLMQKLAAELAAGLAYVSASRSTADNVRALTQALSTLDQDTLRRQLVAHEEALRAKFEREEAQQARCRFVEARQAALKERHRLEGEGQAFDPWLAKERKKVHDAAFLLYANEQRERGEGTADRMSWQGRPEARALLVDAGLDW